MRFFSLSFLILAGCSPVLDSVAPDSVPFGEPAEIVVSGTGLAAEMEFVLEAPGLTVATQTLSGDDGEVTVEVPRSAPAGRYSIVADPDGSAARLDDALSVLADRARFVFVDVGQGDATLIIAPDGEVALIDGGKAGRGDVIREAIDTYAKGRLDMVLLSHYDADHLAGVVEYLVGPDQLPGTDDDIVPERRFAPADEGACDSQLCGRFRNLSAYPFVAPSPDAEIPLGSITIVVEAVGGRVGNSPAPTGLDENGRSLVVSARFADRSVLVMGDVTGGGLGTADVETSLAQHTGPVDILRTAHHGSATSSNAASIGVFSPSYAIISVGTDNTYCHPVPAVLSRIASASSQVIATGAGIDLDADDCGYATMGASNVELGAGDIVLDIDALGEISRGESMR